MGVGVEELGHWKRQIPRLFEIHGLHDKGQTRAIGCGGFWPLNCDRKQNPVEDLIIVWDMLRNITLTYELDPDSPEHGLINLLEIQSHAVLTAIFYQGHNANIRYSTKGRCKS